MNNSRIAAILLVIVISLIASCGNQEPSEVMFPFTGHAHAGPVCPVVQDQPDPACADRPVAGARLVVVDETGDELVEVLTDGAGDFEGTLPAGTYTLVPQAVEGLLGTAAPQAFTTGPDLAPALDVAYDTGIR